MSSSPPRVRLIGGPTASGKSALALDLARETGGVIVNADSMQLYRDLRILTARPTEAEEALAPHRLYGVADAADGWSVGRWLRAAAAVIEDIRQSDRPAIVVGGTGLYFHALTRGLADVPPVEPEARDEAAARLARDGEQAFRTTLRQVDERAERRIEAGDRQRLVRAFSVYAATGRSLSDWQADTRPLLGPDDYEAQVVDLERERLYARCDARLDLMLAQGVLDEVAALAGRELDPTLPAMKATGLRQLMRHVAGQASLEEALEEARRETRRYAKRQLTWFRNQTPHWPRVPPG